MVQDADWNEMKEKIYEIIANSGIWFLYKFFPEYFAKEPLGHTDRYIEYPFALSYVSLWSKSRVLDVGSAGSMFPLLIKSLGHDVNVIDIRKCNYDGIVSDKESICKSHFIEDNFDIITAISTIEHIGLKGRYGVNENDSDTKAIEEIHRILRPNGMFIMTVPFGDEYRETKFHRIYDGVRIKSLLSTFNSYVIDTYDSPEDTYKLALIKAVK
jgi:SAM-dependent methyltransferase